MSGTIIVIRPNGQIEQHRWEPAGLPTEDVHGRQRMQSLLGSEHSYLEHVDAIWEGQTRLAFADEEGIRKNLADNMTATKLLTRESARRGQILGTMLIWVPDREYEKAQADEAAAIERTIASLTRGQIEDLLIQQGFSIDESESIDSLLRKVHLVVRAEELTLDYLRRFQQRP
jgi:hypothetical protein